MRCIAKLSIADYNETSDPWMPASSAYFSQSHPLAPPSKSVKAPDSRTISQQVTFVKLQPPKKNDETELLTPPQERARIKRFMYKPAARNSAWGATLQRITKCGRSINMKSLRLLRSVHHQYMSFHNN